MGEPIRFDFGTGSDPDRVAPNSGPRHWNAYVEAVDDAKMALPIHADDGFVNFSPDAQTRPDQYTKVLLHFDGADGSTSIADDNTGGGSHTWTAAGNAQIDIAQSKFGGASLLLDGTGDYVSTPDHADFTLGGGDWTVDFWFNSNLSAGTEGRLCGQTDAGQTGAGSSFFMRKTTADVIEALISDGATITAIVAGTTTFTAAGWHHVALVRDGNTVRLFIDGVEEDSAAFTGTVPDSAGDFAIGTRGGGSTLSPWNGWIDEFRLSVGVARWADDFTPPVNAYHNSIGNIRALPVVLGNHIYALLGAQVVRIDGSGNRLAVGGVPGTVRAIMARNDKAITPQIVIVVDGGTRFVVENDTVSSIADADLPPPNSCTFLNRKIVFGIDDGRFFWSEIDDATDINSLDFAEAEGNPDGGVRVFAHLQELWVFGTESIEVWYDDGTSFVRRGSTVIPKGCIGKHTIADLDMDLFWVGNDNVAYAARGYAFERISTHAVEKSIRETADKNSIVGWSYFRDGSAFYVLSGPDWTWRFNRTLSRKLGKPIWTERYSYDNGGRWLAEYAVQFNNEWIIGNNADDGLYRLSADAYDEAGDYLVWKVRSAPLHAYPKQICIDRLHLDFVTGVGLVSSDAHESDPQVGLRWSDDGGRTWSNQIFAPLGASGQYETRVTFDGLGMTGRTGRIFEVEISSPVVRSLMYAAIEGDPAGT